MKAFQQVHVSSTVASVHTWEKEWQVSVIFLLKELGEIEMKLTCHPSTSLVDPFCIQL